MRGKMGKADMQERDETSPRTAGQTAAAYHQLRHEILNGALKPGERLTAENLRQRLGAGSSPVREALNRLLAEGLVALEEQKGFRVAPVSLEDLRELVKARCWIDGAAIAESINRFERTWENGLVLALHHLSRSARLRGNGAQENAEWEQLHRAFHLALVNGCGSHWMIRTSCQLFDAAERYRLLAADEVSERNELDEHAAIVEACLDRNSAKAVELLSSHYGRTFDVIAQHFAQPDASAN